MCLFLFNEKKFQKMVLLFLTSHDKIVDIEDVMALVVVCLVDTVCHCHAKIKKLIDF